MCKYLNLIKKTNQRNEKREIALTPKGARQGKNILLWWHCPPRESTLSQNVFIGNETLLFKYKLNEHFCKQRSKSGQTGGK